MKMEQVLDNVKEFINQYPKAKQLLLQWQRRNIASMQKFMAEGMSSDEVSIPELNDALVEESLVISFVANHRFLYDFFDENQVYVFIKKGEEDQMCYEINGVAGECFSSRVDAEQAGFKSALEKLENENQ